jgi:hypothetical protein
MNDQKRQNSRSDAPEPNAVKLFERPIVESDDSTIVPSSPELGHSFSAIAVDATQLALGDTLTQEHPSPALASRPGRALPDDARTLMEQKLGHNFADIRVHEGNSAQSVGAVAYTRGSDLHFAPGRYNPTSSQGRRLLGHELAHVVQQREGRVPVTGSVGGMPLNDDPRLEAEADRIGESVS